MENAENKDLKELEIYRKHFADMREEITQMLAEKAEDKQSETDVQEPDIRRELDELRKEIAELKDALKQKSDNVPLSENHNQPQFQAFPGMFIFPAPPLQYIKTPDYAPVMPTVQNITTNNGER